jgi:hypothetical protein
MDWLIDTSAFLPRSSVGMSPTMTTIYQICCLLHFLGHTTIPGHILYIWYRKRHTVPCPGTMLWLVSSNAGVKGATRSKQARTRSVCFCASA